MGKPIPTNQQGWGQHTFWKGNCNWVGMREGREMREGHSKEIRGESGGRVRKGQCLQRKVNREVENIPSWKAMRKSG